MNIGDVRDITDLYNRAYGYDIREYGWKILHEAQFDRSHVMVSHNEKVVAFQKGIFLDEHLLKVMLRNTVRELIDINTGHLIDAFHGLYSADEIRFGTVGEFTSFRCPGITVRTQLGVGLLSAGFQLDHLSELSLQSQVGEQFIPPLSIKRVAQNNLSKEPMRVDLKECALEIVEDRRNWDDIFIIDFHSVDPGLISFTKHHIVLELVDENYFVQKQHRKYTLFIHNGLMAIEQEDVYCEWSEQIEGYGDLVINPYTRNIADYIENSIVYDGEYIFKNHHDTYVRVGQEWIMVNDNWFHSPRIPKHVKDEYEMCRSLRRMGV